MSASKPSPLQQAGAMAIGNSGPALHSSEHDTKAVPAGDNSNADVLSKTMQQLRLGQDLKAQGPAKKPGAPAASSNNVPPAPAASVTHTPNNSVIHSTNNSQVGSQSYSSGSKDPNKKKQSISYAAERVIGNGSFGVVYQATVIETGETVAIKKVLQDRRFKNRELQIMGMLDHPDVVALKHCFYSKGEKPDDVFLNLVMEYIPETIHRTLRVHTKAKKLVPILFTKVYMYQVARALAYIHSMGICHRDIKPQNLLLNTKSHDVKLCDFGSAKLLVRGEPNVAYICSRYYRAPELVFEATEYTCSIDIWSLGCVMAELLLGKPLFPGDSGVDQLIEIIKILGTPTKEQITAMNPNHTSFKFPQIKPHPWSKVFRNKAPPDAIDLVSRFLHYEPHLRLDPFESLAHPFFEELRDPNCKLPNGRPLPNLFNFTEGEWKRMEQMGWTNRIVPPHLVKGLRDKFKHVQQINGPYPNPYASPFAQFQGITHHSLNQPFSLVQPSYSSSYAAQVGSAPGTPAPAAASSSLPNTAPNGGPSVPGTAGGMPAAASSSAASAPQQQQQPQQQMSQPQVGSVQPPSTSGGK